MPQVIETTKIYEIEESDRLISVTKNENEIININFSQGLELEELRDYINKQNKELTQFVLARLDYAYADSQIEAIDDILWEYIEIKFN